jgi:very-short-patch-repair endonuclease
MSAREPLDPSPDREQRSAHENPDTAGNELPAHREERSACEPGDVEGNELPGLEGADVEISRVATSQRGPVTYGQLTDAGLRHSAIGRRSDRGLLHRIHRGIYVPGHQALAQYARESAALLVAGERAVISHISAASLWGFAPPTTPQADVHITTVGQKIRSRPGLKAHRSQTLEPRDVRRLHGFPLTAPARTLHDLAATGYPDLERAFGDAHAQRLVTAREIEQQLDRAGRRRGSRALRDLLSDNASGYTRSRAERILRRLLRAANLPMARFNDRVAGYEVDAVWPEQRVIVEVDGFAYHGHRGQFERDRKKDLALRAAGYRVIRVSWRQLTNEPFALVAVLAAELSLGR